MVVVEWVLYPTAVAILCRPEAALKQAVTALGRGRFSRWRAES
jgi:hypothetical protein